MTKLIRMLSVVLIPLALLLNQTASAADYGTPADAKAMLEKAAVELKQDKAKAPEMSTKGKEASRFVIFMSSVEARTANLLLIQN